VPDELVGPAILRSHHRFAGGPALEGTGAERFVSAGQADGVAGPVEINQLGSVLVAQEAGGVCHPEMLCAPFQFTAHVAVAGEEESGTSATCPISSSTPDVLPVLKEYSVAAQRFIDLTTQLFNSDKINLTAKDYAAAGNQARDASFKLWRVADAELDILLQKRIEY